MFHVKHLLFLFFFFPQFVLYCQTFNQTVIKEKPLPALPYRISAIDLFTDQSSVSRGLTLEVKEWIYWINYSRTKPVLFWDSVVAPLLIVYPDLNTGYAKSLKVDLYKTKDLGMLKPDSLLTITAKAHSTDLSSHNARPSHNSTNGISFAERLKRSGVVNCYGENISYGDVNTVLALVFLYIDEGIPGLGHRRTLLNPDYKNIGVGVSRYSNGSVMIVQDFSCAQAF